MTAGPLTDLALLEHLQECLRRISEYTQGVESTFTESSMVQDAVVRNLQTLAETTTRLSAELKDTEPGVPWEQIRGFRNVLTHDYLIIDMDVVWSIIESDVPALAEAAARMRDRVAAKTDRPGESGPAGE